MPGIRRPGSASRRTPRHERRLDGALRKIILDVEQLVALAGAQELAASEGRWDDLLDVQQELQAVLSGAAGPQPESAREALEEARRRTAATEQLLVGAIVERQGVLERLRVGRRAISAYARVSR